MMRRTMSMTVPPGASPRGVLALGATVAMVATFAGLGVSPADAETTTDLTQGAVFAMSNARDGNTIVAYDTVDGALVEAGRFATGGNGSGSFEDTANSLVLATTGGEIAPNNLVDPDSGQQFLFAPNAGSDTLSVFRVDADGLELVEVQDTSGRNGRSGTKPVSVTVNNGLVYVLNSGEITDDLFDEDGGIIDNCTTGEEPRITGFSLADDGQLTPLNNSTRGLSGDAQSGCAQISFSPDGNHLVVTERLAQPERLDQQVSDNERIDDEGVIDIFEVERRDNPNATRTRKADVFDATGQGPFGFTFTPNGNLLTTEQFDGPPPAGLQRGAAASYKIDGDLQRNQTDLVATSPSIRNRGTDTCWFVADDGAQFAFATSFFDGGRISSYSLDDTGFVDLVDPVASSDTDDTATDNVGTGASDLALNGDSSVLYQLNSLNGTINAFANNGDGTLDFIEQVTPFPQEAFGPGGGMGAPIGLVAN